MIQISQDQTRAMRANVLARRLRSFLILNFPGCDEVPEDEMIAMIDSLINNARPYQICEEYHLQAYVSAAWLLGPGFDRDFPQIAEVLGDFEIASFEKAEFLWLYCETVFATLEGKGPTAGNK